MTPALTLPSTFILTLLLLVGLFFFIKAATKDRTQLLTLMAPEPEEKVLKKIDTYLQQRAYRLIGLDREQSQLTFEGMVQPSIGLALFLMGLMAVGLLCLGLVLSILWPQVGLACLGIVLLSPLSVGLYWQRAQRLEQVLVQIKPQSPSLEPRANGESQPQTWVTVIAHRDELNALKAAFRTVFTVI